MNPLPLLLLLPPPLPPPPMLPPPLLPPPTLGSEALCDSCKARARVRGESFPAAAAYEEYTGGP